MLQKGLIAMYKDDNFMAREGCSEALLRMVIDGKSNCPQVRQDTPSCDGGMPNANESWGITSYPLASVYCPLQEFKDIYDLDAALNNGTIFKELDLPFMGRRINKGGNCRG